MRNKQILGLGKLLGKCFLRPYLAGETGEGFEDEGLIKRGSKEGAAGSGTTIPVGLKRVQIYLIERDVLGYLLGLTLLGLELAVDGDVGILIETGIAFETGFGLCTAFDDREIMIKETNTPFEGFGRMGVYKSVGLALGLLDEFTIGYASCRPSLGEMVGIELEETFSVWHSADNDVFFVAMTFFDGIHRSPVGFVEFYRHKIAHASSARCGIGRELHIMVNDASQTVLNACF